MHQVLHASVLQILRYLLKSIMNCPQKNKTRITLSKNPCMCQMQVLFHWAVLSGKNGSLLSYEMYSIREVNDWKSGKANTWRFRFLALAQILIFHLHYGHPKLFSEFRNAELHSDSPATSIHPCSDQGMIRQCFRFTLFYRIPVVLMYLT